MTAPLKKFMLVNSKRKIIEVEGDKRFWYAISSGNDVEFTMEMIDGTQQIVDEVDEEMLKN